MKKTGKEIKVHDVVAKFIVTYELDKEMLENLPEIEVEPLSFEVELKKVDEDVYFVEFTKLTGDKYEFFNVYDEFVSFSQTK